MRGFRKKTIVYLWLVVLLIATICYPMNIFANDENIFNVKPDINAKGFHTLALKSDGTVWAWGLNHAGQLGDGTTQDSSIPIQVKNVENVASIAIGGEGHSIVAKKDGTEWTWGRNLYGQLGNGHRTTTFEPQLVEGLKDVISVKAGASSSFALKSDGTVWAWGENVSGRLGIGMDGREDSLWQLTPAQVKNLNNIVAIESGSHRLALKDDGTVWTWGVNTYNHLGLNNDKGVIDEPEKIDGLVDIVQISVTGAHSLALDSHGNVWTWGISKRGNIYTTLDEIYADIQKVPSLDNVVKIKAGSDWSLALKEDGSLWTWGYAKKDGTFSPEPYKIEGLNNVVAFDVSNRTFVVTKDGSVYAWGVNAYGSLGIRTEGSSITEFTEIPNFSLYPRVEIDGEIITYDTPPIISHGSVMVPFRTTFNELGAEVEWDAETNVISAMKDDTTLSFSLGHKYVSLNNNELALSAYPVSVNGVTYVPLRFVSESLGASVSWDQQTETAKITLEN